MKHELIVPKTEKIHRIIADEALRFCGSNEYAESEFDFPVVLGKDEKEEPIVVGLPSLGNTLLFGPTGGTSLYEGVLLAQILWAKHPKPLDVDVFDFPIGALEGVCVGHGQYATGTESEFGVFLEKIRATIEERKAGKEGRTRKVFFVHILSAKPKNLNRNVLDAILKEDLGRLGLQFILCGETSAAASYLKQYADLFDSAIEIATAHNSSRLYGVIRTERCTREDFVRGCVYSIDFPSK